MVKNVILCVDDEKIILDSIKTQLKERYGNAFMYEAAESATEALEIIDELMRDEKTNLVIITDWQMPVIKGDDFLVKVHRKYPKTLKIMLTGHADKESIENSKNNANLFRCLKKPWSRYDLFSTIESGLLKI